MQSIYHSGNWQPPGAVEIGYERSSQISR